MGSLVAILENSRQGQVPEAWAQQGVRACGPLPCTAPPLGREMPRESGSVCLHLPTSVAGVTSRLSQPHSPSFDPKRLHQWLLAEGSEGSREVTERLALDGEATATISPLYFKARNFLIIPALQKQTKTKPHNFPLPCSSVERKPLTATPQWEPIQGKWPSRPSPHVRNDALRLCPLSL